MKNRETRDTIIIVALIIFIPVAVYLAPLLPRFIPRPLHIGDSFTELRIAESQNDVRTVLTFNKPAGELSIIAYEEYNGTFIPDAIVRQKYFYLSEEKFEQIIDIVNKYHIPVCDIETFDQLECTRNTLLLSPEFLISTSNDPNGKLSMLYDELAAMFKFE